MPTPPRLYTVYDAPTIAARVSSGSVRLELPPRLPLAGRHVVVVEDIVDSGRTLQALLDTLAASEPASLAVCALLHKRHATQLTHPVRFVGFEAPDAFLVGYGLDDAEAHRQRPDIARIG
jgi:hypoxanthine phosphoribosyltransferase